MACLSLTTLAWLLLAATAAAGAQPRSRAGVRGHIIECEGSECVERLANAVQEKGGRVRHRFDSDLFRGISVQLGNSTTAEEAVAGLERARGVKGVWPVQESRPAGNVQGDVRVEGTEKQARHGAGKRAADDLWTHRMTGVDRLHEEGFTGNGIKIAVVDTGVDYTHPALGGCFGKGCRVAFGANLLSEGDKGDPKDCAGHGTRVAGIVAGYSREDGFVGVAPNATLMAYRVVDCEEKGVEDDMMAGWLQAYEDGAQIIVSSTGLQGSSWAQRPLAMVASRIAARGVPCVVGLGNIRDHGLFNAMAPSTGDGVVSVNSVNRDYEIGGYSAYGPTWDLRIKPNIIAPGENIWMTMQGGTYSRRSGTSYATPLVAGVMALVAEARGGDFHAGSINNLVMSTAKPQRHSSSALDVETLRTVAQQGGGLVDAWEAAHATTLVQPAGLEFNDTEHRVPSIDLRITNTNTNTARRHVNVSYTLSSFAATTLYTFPSDTLRLDPNTGFTSLWGTPVPATAKLDLNQTSLTLGPGQSATINVSAREPAGLDATRLPLWSGFVHVVGSDGTNLTVPYLGLSGSLRSATNLQPNTLEVRVGSPDSGHVLDNNNKTYSLVLLDPPSGQKPGAPASITELLPEPQAGSLFLRLKVLASPQVLMDIVPLDLCPPGNGTSPPLSTSGHCVPSCMLKDSYGLESIGQVAGCPLYYVSRSGLVTNAECEWDGAFADGRYAPPGRYKIVVRALAVFGRVDNPSDWQVTESPVFSMLYYHNYKPPADWDPSREE